MHRYVLNVNKAYYQTADYNTNQVIITSDRGGNFVIPRYIQISGERGLRRPRVPTPTPISTMFVPTSLQVNSHAIVLYDEHQHSA